MLGNKIFISDLHIPYQHPDAFRFLKKIRDEFGIEDVLNVGDVVDNHCPSFHEVEYGCLSPKEEYDTAKIMCQELSDIFPKMRVSFGNHDELPNRKAKVAGIPDDCIVDINKRYGVNWDWARKHYFKVDDYNDCLMTHNLTANTLSNARNYSHCSVQGHHHSLFGVEYFSDQRTLRWAMSTGCLIDIESPAFNYMRQTVIKRPIIGCGALIEERPVLFPMRLKSNGRWDGYI